MPGLTELDSKFFIVRQLLDKKNVGVIQSLNCIGNVIATQRLGKNDKDKSRTRNILLTFGSGWDARKVIAKAIEIKFFSSKNTLITAELSPKEHALDRQ